jgi:hypothetical protein
VVDGIFHITTVAENGHINVSPNFLCFVTKKAGTQDLVRMRFSYASYVTYLIATYIKLIQCHFKPTTVLPNPHVLPSDVSRSAGDRPLPPPCFGPTAPLSCCFIAPPLSRGYVFLYTINFCIYCIDISRKEIDAVATHGHSTSLY